MSRRPRNRPTRPSRTILQALAAFEISCNCKASLIVSCAVGAASGCRERRREGTCACRPRYLPACILDAPGGAGCSVWREGKTCQCKRLYMPRCLVAGCADRRRGKRCDCPRTPLELCPHVAAKHVEYAALTPRDAERMADAWAEKLWALLPEKYADKPEAFAGCHTPTQQTAVNLMAIRHALNLSLWHPQDRRGSNEDEQDARRRHQHADGLRRLLAIKGGARKGDAL